MFKLFLSEFTSAWKEGRIGDGLRAAGKICNGAGDVADLLLGKPATFGASEEDCDTELTELQSAIATTEAAPTMAVDEGEQVGNPVMWLALAKAVFDIVSEIRKNRKK